MIAPTMEAISLITESIDRNRCSTLKGRDISIIGTENQASILSSTRRVSTMREYHQNSNHRLMIGRIKIKDVAIQMEIF